MRVKFSYNISQELESKLKRQKEDKIDSIYLRIKKKCQQIKYYKSIIFMVHVLPDKTFRKLLIGKIANVNAFLAARIITTICEDTQEEQNYLLNILIYKSIKAYKPDEQKLLLLALIELEEYEIFESRLKYNLKLFRNDYDSYSNLTFYFSQLRTDQQLVLISLILKYNNKFRLQPFRYVLESTYESNEGNDNKILAIVKNEIDKGNLSNIETLLRVSKLNLKETTANLSAKNRMKLKYILFNRPRTPKRSELALYYFLSYQLSIQNMNNLYIWHALLEEENVYEYLHLFCRFLKYYYFKCKIIKAETIEMIYDYLNLNLIVKTNNTECKEIFINGFVTGKRFFQPPFFSLMKNESFLMAFLNGERYQNSKFVHLYIKLINKNQHSGFFFVDKYSSSEIEFCYNYFDECLKNYSRVDNFIRVYFNSSMKYTISCEYFIEKVINQFKCSSEDLKILFKDIFFKGKIYRVDENWIFVTSNDFNADFYFKAIVGYGGCFFAGMEIYFAIVGLDFENKKQIVIKIVSPSLNTIKKQGCKYFFDQLEICGLQFFIWDALTFFCKIPMQHIDSHLIITMR